MNGHFPHALLIFSLTLAPKKLRFLERKTLVPSENAIHFSFFMNPLKNSLSCIHLCGRELSILGGYTVFFENSSHVLKNDPQRLSLHENKAVKTTIDVQ